jgi:hypothetical protein
LGGYGSGWQGSSAPTVERLRKIDLAELERLELRNEGDQKALGSSEPLAHATRADVIESPHGLPRQMMADLSIKLSHQGD